MDFELWWNSRGADAFRAAHPDADGREFQFIWDAACETMRAAFEDECDRTDSLLTILGLEIDRCRSEGGSLIPRTVLTLMAEAGHPPRFSERDCELLGNGLAYIIREYPEKADHARALLERMAG